MLLKKIKHVLLAITGGLIIFSAGAQAKNDKTAIGAIYLDTQGVLRRGPLGRARRRRQGQREN